MSEVSSEAQLEGFWGMQGLFIVVNDMCVCVHTSVYMLVCVMHMCVVCMSCGVCGMYACKYMSVCVACVCHMCM